MKKLAVAVVFLAIAGVLFAQDAPKAENPEAAAPAAAAGEVKEAPAAAAPAGEVKEAPAAAAPAAAQGEFCVKVRKDGSMGKCHKKGCEFFPTKGNIKCFPTADAAKSAGVTSFCKICCKDLQ